MHEKSKMSPLRSPVLMAKSEGWETGTTACCASYAASVSRAAVTHSEY